MGGYGKFGCNLEYFWEMLGYFVSMGVEDIGLKVFWLVVDVRLKDVLFYLVGRLDERWFWVVIGLFFLRDWWFLFVKVFVIVLIFVLSFFIKFLWLRLGVIGFLNLMMIVFGCLGLLCC